MIWLLFMSLVELSGRHNGKYVVYDENGKVIIITRNKAIALYYLNNAKLAA